MEQVIPKVSETAWEDVHTALTSGEYTQVAGGMCKENGENDRSHCCMGVINEVVFDAEWSTPNSWGFLVDEDGEEGNLSEEKAEALGLNEFLTSEEVDRLADYGEYLDTDFKRHIALAHMNDHGVDFDTIDMLIRELGWDQIG